MSCCSFIYRSISKIMKATVIVPSWKKWAASTVHFGGELAQKLLWSLCINARSNIWPYFFLLPRWHSGVQWLLREKILLLKKTEPTNLLVSFIFIGLQRIMMLLVVAKCTPYTIPILTTADILTLKSRIVVVVAFFLTNSPPFLLSTRNGPHVQDLVAEASAPKWKERSNSTKFAICIPAQMMEKTSEASNVPSIMEFCIR